MASARSVADAIAASYDRLVKDLIIELREGNTRIDADKVSKINQQAMDFAVDQGRVHDLAAANNPLNLPTINEILETWTAALSAAQQYAHSVGVDVVLVKPKEEGGFFVKLFLGGLILWAISRKAA